ncbi:outer membrane usher protein [Acinetobacter rudis CIP 110305]|uniref:Outer membrane usher protein n=1 Tax=Acinetobacter rudis CIP 110305 TaxID=421052 RepID=S3N7Q2_9GAMM|nr:outer membrane usher protein [Acinetobacter rudis CIP 110305]
MNINGRYRTNYATLTSSYNIADRYQQAMLNVSGNIVAHAGGVLFGAEQGQTMVLVYAPDAAGAKVNNVAGLSINKAGYAVIPYVTPYRLNDVTLDPQNMSTRVELEESSQRIAPFAGAIAKVDFNTKKGYAIYIHTRTKDGGHLPFAAQVTNQDQQVVGMVAQGSMIYLRSPLSKDHLQVHWGENNTVQCHIDYDISQQLKIKQQDAIVTEAICQ